MQRIRLLRAGFLHNSFSSRFLPKSSFLKRSYCTYNSEESDFEDTTDNNVSTTQIRSPASKNVTPAMRQYQILKDSVPGYILFFQMGDFFEIFYEDAILVSKLLDLTLTARGKTEKASKFRIYSK